MMVAPVLIVWGAPVRLALARQSPAGRAPRDRRACCTARACGSRRGRRSAFDAVLRGDARDAPHGSVRAVAAQPDRPRLRARRVLLVRGAVLRAAGRGRPAAAPAGRDRAVLLADGRDDRDGRARRPLFLFDDAVRYPYYLAPARALHVSALADQQLAGDRDVVGGGVAWARADARRRDAGAVRRGAPPAPPRRATRRRACPARRRHAGDARASGAARRRPAQPRRDDATGGGRVMRSARARSLRRPRGSAGAASARRRPAARSAPGRRRATRCSSPRVRSCHGLAAQGIPGRAPSLHGVGALAADFYLETGRMPLAPPRRSRCARSPAFPQSQIRALIAYVASFGGPAIPTVTPRPGLALRRPAAVRAGLRRLPHDPGARRHRDRRARAGAEPGNADADRRGDPDRPLRDAALRRRPALDGADRLDRPLRPEHPPPRRPRRLGHRSHRPDHRGHGRLAAGRRGAAADRAPARRAHAATTPTALRQPGGSA